MRVFRVTLVGLVLLLAGFVAACSAETAAPAGTTTGTAARAGSSGLPTVALADLPVEAQRNYALIADGGPYPYPQDDRAFGNREGILPDQEYGWYREYTVPTPGSPDRGARRFVVGEDAVHFYTDDHYASFREVQQ